MSGAPSETHVLLSRWHGGDRASLEQLLARDMPWLIEQVRRRLGSLLKAKGEVEDYVHEAVVDALQYGPRFVMSDKAQFRALMARIVENILRGQAERWNAQKREARREREVPRDTILSLDPPMRDVTRPSMAAQRDADTEWIRLAIELLPPEDRALVRWREWDQVPFAEIGEQLGISADAARMRFARVLPKLASTVERLRRGEIEAVLSDIQPAE